MNSWSRFVAVYCLFILTAVYIGFHRETPAPLASPLSLFPSELGSWHMVHQETFSPAMLSVLRPSDYLSRSYQNQSGKTVQLYIGYHDGGQGSGPIHSPKNCLPGSGWLEVYSRPLEFDFNGKRIRLTQAVYRQGDRQELFVYWFMVRSNILSNEIGLKLAEIANSVRYGQRGASFVRLSLGAASNPTESLSTLEDFLRQAYPTILGYMTS